MPYQWTDVIAIAEDLADLYPDQDPQYIRFTDLHRWVLALPDFEDEPNRCNENILEAIQMAWIKEIDR